VTARWIEATTVGDLLLGAAERSPDAIAVAFPEESATYARFVNERPMSATKIQRFCLRDRLPAELGLDSQTGCPG
jgi:non-ribosomal peptide synthetase component F